VEVEKQAFKQLSQIVIPIVTGYAFVVTYYCGMIVCIHHVSDSMEWVEMLEPHSQELMYVNVKTGECVWRPPPGVAV